MSEFMEKKRFLYSNLFLVFFLVLTSMVLDIRVTELNGKSNTLFLLFSAVIFIMVIEGGFVLRSQVRGMQKMVEGKEIARAEIYNGVYRNPYDQNQGQKEETDKAALEEAVARDYDFIAVIDGKTEYFEVCRQKERAGLFFAKYSSHNVKFDKMTETMIKKGVDVKERTDMKKAFSLNLIRSELDKKEEYIIYFHTPSRKLKRQRYLYLNRKNGSLILTQTDVTDAFEKEQKENEEIKSALYTAKESAQARTDFFSSVSQDMRSSVEEMSCLTDIAVKAGLMQQKQDYLQMIKKREEQLSRVLNHTLEISRFDSGSAEMKLECVEGCELIHEITEMIKSAAYEKNIRFFFKSDCLPGKILYVDKIHIKELCLNLLTNAVQFTPNGGSVWFSIKQMHPDHDGRNVKIMIRDNGIGMAREFQKNMFEPFSKEYSCAEKESRGAGLGLSLVKRIIELMNGTIQVESEEGRGTTCTVLLNIQTRSRSSLRKDQADYSPLKQRHILLIENNMLNVDIVKTMLERKGMNVTWAENGRIGLSLFEKSPNGYYDMILTGIHMPVMGGYEAAAKIRRSAHPDAAEIPIVAINENQQENLELYEDAGITGHLTKPIEPERLYFLLLEQLSERK